MVKCACLLGTRELASKASVAPDTIGRIDGGDYKKLRPSTMRKIARALGVHPGEIAEFALVASETGGN